MGNYRSRKLGVCVSVAVLAVFIGCTLLAYTAFASSTTNHSTLQQVVFVSNSFVKQLFSHTALHFYINKIFYDNNFLAKHISMSSFFTQFNVAYNFQVSVKF